MALPVSRIEPALAAAERALAGVRSSASGDILAVLSRWRADAQAIAFHLAPRPAGRPPLVAILGGTGTGKSTLVNRLLGANLTATSFRRTFTAGPVAITSDIGHIPPGWLGLEHHQAELSALPARGEPDALTMIRDDRELTRAVTLIDTPDLDGDQPLHHAQADRVFRWAQALVFLVTPEKYQMTELLPYYRLARRYGIPALFVMNKAEEAAVVEDYRQQLGGRDWPAAKMFAVARDDAGWEPPAEQSLAALKQAVMTVDSGQGDVWRAGVAQRTADLLDRLQDQIIHPLREQRYQVTQLVAAIQSLEAPQLGLDVNPVTQQLQRRLQQRSVLYLIGPQRIMERVRQVPGMVLRLPRTLWDVVFRGKGVQLADPKMTPADSDQAQVPDFVAAVTDQFTVLQSRIEDVLRSSTSGARWLADNEASWREARLDPALAGQAAAEEIKDLEQWLNHRWNATPRDTMLLMRLLRHLPGGQKLTRWTEAAPYLLAVVVATHHAFFGPIDLVVLGGYSLATWLTEKVSNEVAQRARAANRHIADRFAELAHQQIERICRWLNQQAPGEAELDALEKAARQLDEAIDAGR